MPYGYFIFPEKDPVTFHVGDPAPVDDKRPVNAIKPGGRKQAFKMSEGNRRFQGKNVSLDDIFHSWRTRNFSTNVTNAYITSLAYSDTRRVGVSLNYRFGNNREMKRGKSSNANDDRI